MQAPAASERDVVVEIVALHSSSRGAGILLTLPWLRWPAARAAAGPASATSAAEHLQLIRDDLGGITLVALFVLPLARAQAPLDVDLRALAQVFRSDLGQA